MARAKTPPYTGYGSWDDSMGSVTHLIPKQPKKDLRFGGVTLSRRSSSEISGRVAGMIQPRRREEPQLLQSNRMTRRY